ncbi:MAG: MucR family transcriptional regulator [Alphaproteobacteria bacterium RIFOXYD12_FULL_60_8]|nr:MAG: MucR family transcriptional regulator [Alphaproteobacteria bacterium RIFOXYD12_FULL_60_8]
MSDQSNSAELLSLTVDIVSAHVANNTVPVSELSEVICQVFKTLSGLGGVIVEPERPQPAVPVKKSISNDYIVCLEDGKKLKMLKRHLMTAYNMTPEAYRERWGLPADYPMVAPSYAQHRSKLAREIGLGTTSKRKKKS